MLLRSQLLRQQPVKPLDRAIFWIEHVLKFRGAPYIQNVGAKLKWYQYYLLDVIGVLFIILAFVVYIASLLLREVVYLFKSRCSTVKAKSKTS